MPNTKTERPGEIWRPVVGYEGLYDVSSRGHVRSLLRPSKTQKSKNHTRIISGRPLALGRRRKGYTFVGLRRDGKGRRFFVHRLVAYAFIGPAPKSPGDWQVNHRDGNKTNNAVANLEWVTGEQNREHAFMNGLNPPGYASLTAKEVVEIRQRYAAREASMTALADEYGTSTSNIDKIIANRSWKNVHLSSPSISNRRIMNAHKQIAEERKSQIAKGYTPECDDQHTEGELARLAEYILSDLNPSSQHNVYSRPAYFDADSDWVTKRAAHIEAKYHDSPEQRLIIAGALIEAEFERRMRLVS